MKILEVKEWPQIKRRAVYVVQNEQEPRWVHPNGVPAPAGHTGDITESPNACKVCRLNWNIVELLWTGDELEQSLNKWGNPARVGQVPSSVRTKTWDELYNEAEKRLGVPIDRTGAPRQAPPAAVPEKELEFSLLPIGDPNVTSDGLISQTMAVLHHGISRVKFTASGTTKEEFSVSRESQYQAYQKLLRDGEEAVAKAKAILGS